VILVEVRKAVIEEDGRFHVFGERELENTLGYVDIDAATVALGDVFNPGPHGVCIRVFSLEGHRYQVGVHLRSLVRDGLDYGCVITAVCVVDLELLNLGTGVEKQATDGGEYYPDGEEEREDGLGGEDRSEDVLVSGPRFEWERSSAVRHWELTAKPLVAVVERRYLESENVVRICYC
jgi:hypothetical protein